MGKKKKSTTELIESTEDGNKQLAPTDVIEEIVTNVVQFKKGDRRHKFFLYWILGLPINSCARLAGYNRDYGYKLVQQYRKRPKLRHTLDTFLNIMPERYKSLCKLRLADVAEIEGAGLEEYRDKPRLAIEKPQLLKQIKQGAGVLNDDAPQPPTVNIRSVQQLMFQINQEKNEELRKIENTKSVNPKTPNEREN